MIRSRRTFLASTLLTLVAACGGNEGSGPEKKPAGDAEGSAPPTPAASDEDAADLIIWGGRVVTMKMDTPEVEAVAIRDGVFVKVGKRRLVEKLKGADTVILDLGGGIAVPGLTDAHAHLSGLGASLEAAELRGATSPDDVVARVKKAAPPSGWILGRGWDQNLWPGKAMPTHEPLTTAFPDRPVFLRRVDGHAAWANQKVLEAAGITDETPDPEGGEILRDEEGHATGVLVDAAMDLVTVPPPSKDDVRRHLLAGQAHVLERGITGVHDMGIGPVDHDLYQELAASGELKLRIHAYASEKFFLDALIETKRPEVKPEQVYALVGVKLYADGALGSRGAAMLKSYSDRPGHKGKLMHRASWYADTTTKAVGNDWSVATHAIGDRGNRVVLDAYDTARQRHRTQTYRLRLEHAQILDPADIGRMSTLGVVASMQPTHATSDMPWVPDRVGEERAKGAYAWQRVLKSGAHLTFGSDFPVELADITHGLYAAVTRQDAAGKPDGGWFPDQRVSMDVAVAGFTREAAFAVARGDHLGAIAEGYRADMTLFAEDLWKISADQVRTATINATVVDGKVAWKKD